MKIIAVIITAILLMGFFSFLTDKFSQQKESMQPVVGSIYEFSVPTLDGKDVIDFSNFKGKKLLIVNTASRCGYTPQYAGLQKLHEQYGDKLIIVGFPANNFLWQEPGTNEEIAAFCEKNYGVTFPMAEKISVKGNDKHPLYTWLESKSGESPSWNFCKYVVSEDGTEVNFFSNRVEPTDKKIIDLISK